MWSWLVTGQRQLLLQRQARIEHSVAAALLSSTCRASARSGSGGGGKKTKNGHAPNKSLLDAAAKRLLDKGGLKGMLNPADEVGQQVAARQQQEQRLLHNEQTRSIRPAPKMTAREAATHRESARILRDAQTPSVRAMAEGVSQGEEKFPVALRFEEMFATLGPASQHFMVGKDAAAVDKLGERLRRRGLRSPETRHVYERVLTHADDDIDHEQRTEHDLSVSTLRADLQRTLPAQNDAMRGELPDYWELSMENARWVDQAHTGVRPDGVYDPDDDDEDEHAGDDDDDDDGDAAAGGGDDDDDGDADADDSDDDQMLSRNDEYRGDEVGPGAALDDDTEPDEDDTPFRSWDPRLNPMVTQDEAANVSQVMNSQRNEEILDRVRDTISPEIVRGLVVEQRDESESDLSDHESTFKVCVFCSTDPPLMDPMNVHMLAKYLDPIGHILPRLDTGLCPVHQRKLSRTIKRAHHLKLLSYKHRAFVINDPFVPPVPRLSRFGDDDELPPFVTDAFVELQQNKVLQADQDSIDADNDNPLRVFLNDPSVVDEPFTEEELRIVDDIKAHGISFEVPDPVLGFIGKNKPAKYVQSKKDRLTTALDLDDDMSDLEEMRRDAELFNNNFLNDEDDDLDLSSDDDDDDYINAPSSGKTIDVTDVSSQ